MFEIGNDSKLRHGHSRRGHQSAEYICWQAIKRRCLDPKRSKFEYYGGRGIKICDRWENSFENFLFDVGPRPSRKHSIDRFPNRHGNYEPGNVRWATRQQQTDNRDCTRWVELNGEKITVSDACQRLKRNLILVNRRISIGWTPERAVLTARLWSRPDLAGKPRKRK